jgi:outer membrane protein assembly factor BamB
MKMLRGKSKVSTVAFVLALTIAASLITALPVAFGQEKIVMAASAAVFPNPVGINQSVMIEGSVYPAPTPYGAIYHDLNFTITKPDGTKVTILHDSDERGEYDFDYVCDQLGTWRVDVSWPGDETHTETRPPAFGMPFATWTVQEEPVPPLEKITAYAYVATVPKTVGLGQYAYIVGYIVPPREMFGGLYPDLTFTITKPDDTTVSKVMHSDSSAAASFSIVCDQEGTWSVKLSWAGDRLHESCVSELATWTVQTEPLPPYPDVPLPVGPWEYPISAEHREWYQISGAWLQNSYNASAGSFNPYTKAPNTPHVLWKRQMVQQGFLLGGESGHLGRGRVDDFPTFVAAQGRLFYTKSEEYDPHGNKVGTHPVLYCLDQYSGELIWERHLPIDPVKPGTGGALSLEISALLKVDPKLGVPVSGAFSLWLTSGGIWEIDPWTGKTLYYWPGVSGTYYDAAIYISNFNGTKGEREIGTMTRWDTRFRDTVWTAKIPGVSYYWNDILVRYEAPTGAVPFGCKITTWNATTGALIAEGPEYGFSSSDIRIVAYGKFFIHCVDRRTRALSLYTGKEVWESEPMDAPWGTFAAYSASAGYGNVYVHSYDGHLYCYDAETGDQKWRFYSGDTTETAMGTYAWWGKVIIADGKVYAATGEHTPPNPMPRGNKLYCIDAHNGTLIWSLSGVSNDGGKYGGGSCGVSSGMLYYGNQYDGCLYMFGKGKTATEVLVSPSVIANGASVLIKGTVTDQTPSIKGTPAIADEDMAEWMEYLYMNKPMPTDATGVPVMLQAMRSNGSIIDIGWATSDIMGHYEFKWTPPAEDTYKILATFCGSESYWMSSAQTALLVEAAPEAPPEPTEEPAYTAIDLAIIAAVVVVAILVLYTLWTVRKLRK